MRELTTVKIEKISIVGAPANRKTWLLKKADEDEVTVAVAKFLGVDLGVEKAEKAEIVAAIEELEIYKESMPDSMLDACSTLARVCAQGAVEVVEKKVEEDDEVVVDPNDNYPSIYIPMAEEIVEEELEPEKEDEEEDKIDEDDYDPVQIKLKRIEKKLDGLEKDDEPEDPWPSLNPITPGAKIAVKKAKVKVLDPNKKQLAKSKMLSLGEGDEEGLEKMVKVDEDEDNYPSIPDSLFELP